MAKILIDFTDTYITGLNTGIQRVVRNIIKRYNKRYHSKRSDTYYLCETCQ